MWMRTLRSIRALRRTRSVRSRRWRALAAVIGACALSGSATLEAAAAAPTRLPEFTQTDPGAWVNTAPLTVAQLRGHVVLVHVWAFECWNCYRSFPWLNALDEKYRARGLVTVGIHTPELAQESEPKRVIAKTHEFGLQHAVMMDNDYRYWRALGNHYWPAWYVVDARGDIRTVVIGEAHPGDQRARAVEAAIDSLLAETPPAS